MASGFENLKPEPQAKVSQAHGLGLAWPMTLGLAWLLASSQATHITISHMVVQLYEPILHTVQSGKMDFRDRPDRLSLLQVKEYALLTSGVKVQF